MIIIYIILAIIAVVLIAALLVSKDINYEKSIVINSNIEKVWNNVNSLEQWINEFRGGIRIRI